MSKRDYYKILGLLSGASDQEIKKAYRKMALKYHPDRNQGNKEAEENFKEINEAYAVLGDNDKRRMYDQFGPAGFQQRYNQQDIFKNFNFNDIFRDLGVNSRFGQKGAGRRPSSRNFGGSGGVEDIFDNLFSCRRNTGFSQTSESRGPFDQKTKQRTTASADITYNLPAITLKEAAFGVEKTVKYQRTGETKRVVVKIPAGVRTGSKIKLKGQGKEGLPGRPMGDLYFTIKVKDDPVFKRVDDDIYLDREIAFEDASQGTTVMVPTLEGEMRRVKIPPGTANGKAFRLKGYGVSHLKKGGRGDEYLKILVKKEGESL